MICFKFYTCYQILPTDREPSIFVCNTRSSTGNSHVQKYSLRDVLPKAVLKSFEQFTGRHLCPNPFFNEGANCMPKFYQEHLWIAGFASGRNSRKSVRYRLSWKCEVSFYICQYVLVLRLRKITLTLVLTYQ